MELWEVPKNDVRRLTLPLPWRDMLIVFVCDSQVGAQTALRPLRRHVEYYLDKGAYFFGVGDYVDVMSPSNRERWQSAHLYPSAVRSLDDGAMQLVEQFCTLMKGTEGRWLGLLQGHHYHTFTNADRVITTDELIAERLGAQFLGYCAIVRLTFKRPSSSTRLSFNLWAHHGAGSGVTLGAPINTLQRMAACWPNVHMFVVGHQHKQVAAVLPRIHVTEAGAMDLYDRPIRLICAGGWLQGYVPNLRLGGRPAAEYPEVKMLVPVAIGGAVAELIPTRIKDEGREQVYIDSRAIV